jgi:hypothetical protein
VYKRMFMLALLLGSSARPAHAQASQPAVHYHAPEGCPDQAFFDERMQARLRADGVRARPGSRLEIYVELAASGATGRVRIHQGKSNAQRSLDAGSCKEVVEGLALIAALALASPKTSPPPAQTHAHTEPRAPAPATAPSEVESLPAPSQTAPPPAEDKDNSAPVVRASVAARQIQPTETTSGPAREVAQSESPAVDAPEVGEQPSDDPRLRGWSLGAALIAIHGPAPDVRPGLQLGAAWVLGSGEFDLRLVLAGRLALPETSSSAQGTTHFGFVAGVVELCAAAALGGSWSWDGCAVVEPGVLTASGENTRNPGDYVRAWLALGGGTGLSLRLGAWLALRAGVEVLVPTRRDEALLAGEVVHHVPPVCLRLQLGVEARPW